jgi:large subunit ribosomal protein L11
MNSYLSEKQLKKKEIVLNSLPVKYFKILIAAGSASSNPPLGPLLGQYGISIVDFCKEFNEESYFIEKDTIIPIKVYFGNNKNFYIEFQTLSVSYLLKKIIESEEKNNLIYNKNDILKIAYNIAFFKLFIFSNNINISDKFFKNYIYCIIGTMRSFGFIINK